MMDYGWILDHRLVFCCIRKQYNDTTLVLLLALRVGEMCGTTILTSIGLSFLFFRGLLTFSNDTMAYHFASAIRYCQLVLLNMKLQVESSRNTTIPRFIWYIPFSFEHLRLFKMSLWSAETPLIVCDAYKQRFAIRISPYAMIAALLTLSQSFGKASQSSMQ